MVKHSSVSVQIYSSELCHRIQVIFITEVGSKASSISVRKSLKKKKITKIPENASTISVEDSLPCSAKNFLHQNCLTVKTPASPSSETINTRSVSAGKHCITEKTENSRRAGLRQASPFFHQHSNDVVRWCFSHNQNTAESGYLKPRRKHTVKAELELTFH